MYKRVLEHILYGIKNEMIRPKFRFSVTQRWTPHLTENIHTSTNVIDNIFDSNLKLSIL